MYHLECIKKASGFHGSSRLNVVLVLLKKSVLFDARAKNLRFTSNENCFTRTNKCLLCNLSRSQNIDPFQ